MKTICYIAHPDLSQSSSQQYLIESGAYCTNVEYVNLADVIDKIDVKQAKEQLLTADQIIFQFPMYWYQAPGILFEWINQVWSTVNSKQLIGKSLGIVVVIGSKKENYQAGGREGRTVSELLSNFEVLARHFKMHYKPIFAVHQFHYLTEKEKADLMWRYLYYLENKEVATLTRYQQYLIKKGKLLLQPKVQQGTILFSFWESFVEQLEIQASEIEELMDVNIEEEI